MTMLLRDLFISDVTRDIPPVVYFHEQSPEKLEEEVREYIITGGWNDGHPNHRRVPNGIHEQYVRLLRGITRELQTPGGSGLPASWISGFYGSGKSSFAKLLGLALDGIELPSGISLAKALLRRDTTQRKDELDEAWHALRQAIDPIAVVFDIGGVARDNEHIHAAALRQLQKRLGYCSTEPLVAEFELKLERDGEWQRFEQVAMQTLGKPWDQLKDKALAEEEFSQVMAAMFPDKYTDPMSWFVSRAGSAIRASSAEEITRAIADMLRFRKPGKTLFLVIDEVSQYIHQDNQRMLALQSFVSELGQRLKGKVWLLVTGQERLEDASDAVVLGKMKDRFPPALRVHLAATNIRDVVHKRLLQKKPEAEAHLRTLFQQHRHDLKLFAYGCDSITADDFVEVYPLLPGHIDLLLQITSALRTRSKRSQGDDQTIRGLLQLLGELFRTQGLAEQAVGALITLDKVYEIQHTALDSDVQASMGRILSQCAHDSNPLLIPAAKAVALLELIQDTLPTDARLVAACLYDRMDRGSRVAEVTEALEELRRRNLLGYSEKHGYKIQSSAGEEWERERRDISVPNEQVSAMVQDALKLLLADPEPPQLQGRAFPWSGRYSDGRRADNVHIKPARDAASVLIDFRFVFRGEQTTSTWIKRSDETDLRDRLIWVCGDGSIRDQAGELGRSRAMIKKYEPRQETLSAARKILLVQERQRMDEQERLFQQAVAKDFMDGHMYFRGRELTPGDMGTTFATALHAAGTRILPDLFPHFISTDITPSELAPLIELELSGPSPKFLPEDLGILELDAGRYVSSCTGVVPSRILDYIKSEGGSSGASLLAHFGAPPFGYTVGVVRACVAGLLRASKIRIQTDGGEITAMRDPGVRELFDKERDFRRAVIVPAGEDEIGFSTRARICKFFEDIFQHAMDREDHVIADAVAKYFPAQVECLRSVLARLNRLPDSPATPEPLNALQRALEACIRTMRETRPTVLQVKKHLDALGDGMHMLRRYDNELTDEALAAVREAANVRDYLVAQLGSVDALDAATTDASERIKQHLGLPRPWQDIAAINPDIETVRTAYVAERRRLLELQEELAERARMSIKTRPGFSTLTADQAHTVLRPIAQAVTDTGVDAVAPPLAALGDAFQVDLRRAEDRANELLDQILSQLPSEGKQQLIVPMDLELRNREIRTAKDIDDLLEDIRRRLEARLAAGVRVRLL